VVVVVALAKDLTQQRMADQAVAVAKATKPQVQVFQARALTGETM
jgi:hypothetical protein